ncbi:hypothetical protein DL771_006793 [Monosporascus sp. 5C6A]|nr:hypothetical protein DL771_006793 [Monosporascus sp. 5C6A]
MRLPKLYLIVAASSTLGHVAPASKSGKSPILKRFPEAEKAGASEADDDDAIAYAWFAEDEVDEKRDYRGGCHDPLLLYLFDSGVDMPDDVSLDRKVLMRPALVGVSELRILSSSARSPYGKPAAVPYLPRMRIKHDSIGEVCADPDRFILSSD